jgi:hypothetical protein
LSRLRVVLWRLAYRSVTRFARAATGTFGTSGASDCSSRYAPYSSSDNCADGTPDNGARDTSGNGARRNSLLIGRSVIRDRQERAQESEPDQCDRHGYSPFGGLKLKTNIHECRFPTQHQTGIAQ